MISNNSIDVCSFRTPLWLFDCGSNYINIVICLSKSHLTVSSLLSCFGFFKICTGGFLWGIVHIVTICWYRAVIWHPTEIPDTITSVSVLSKGDVRRCGEEAVISFNLQQEFSPWEDIDPHPQGWGAQSNTDPIPSLKWGLQFGYLHTELNYRSSLVMSGFDGLNGVHTSYSVLIATQSI